MYNSVQCCIDKSRRMLLQDSYVFQSLLWNAQKRKQELLHCQVPSSSEVVKILSSWCEYEDVEENFQAVNPSSLNPATSKCGDEHINTICWDIKSLAQERHFLLITHKVTVINTLGSVLAKMNLIKNNAGSSWTSKHSQKTRAQNKTHGKQQQTQFFAFIRGWTSIAPE